jgi:hypothetical protein
MADLCRAEALFERGAKVFECDALAVGLAVTYHGLGRTDDASALLSRYSRTQRRERYSLPNFLAGLAAAFTAPQTVSLAV